MTYSLTGMTSLGSIKNEESGKDAQLFQMPMPVSDSSDAILLDLFGASRTISISGIYAGTTAEIVTFIGQLDALVNGSQTGRTYVSDKSGGTYKVYIQKVSWKAEEAGMNKVEYSIEMIQGS